MWYNSCSMEDTLRIKNLELWTHIGVTEEERTKEQRLLIDISLQIKVPNKDLISIDYEKVAKDIRALGGKERQTIERLATDVADMILKKYSLESVTVTVKKFPLPGIKHVSLTITRP